jgi:Flp pilus assembly protein TadD
MRNVSRIAPAAALALLAVLVFWGGVRHGFTNWDDNKYVTENPLVLSLEPENLRAIFTRVVFHTWAPLNILSYAIDHAVWGMRAPGYHLTNVLLHALCVVLLYLLVQRILGRGDPMAARFPAAVAAGLFAIHPVQVESVAWIAERKNVLGMAFLLGAFLAWIRATDGRFRPMSYAAFLLLLAAALMVKVHAAILAPLVLLYEWIERETGPEAEGGCQAPSATLGFSVPSGRSLTPSKTIGPIGRLALLAPAFAVTLALGLLSMAVGDVEGQTRLTGDLTGAFASAPGLVLGYVEDLLFPMNRSPILEGTVHRSPLEPAALLAWAIVGGWLAIVLARRRESPHAAFASLWFVVGLLPVLHFVPNTPLVADRYQYWAAPGLFALAGLAAARLRENLPPARRSAAAGLGLAALFLLAAVTVAYLPAWKDSTALWTRAVEKTPRDAFAWTKLGETSIQAERLDDAEHALRTALRIEPNFPSAGQLLGLTLIKKGYVADGMRFIQGSGGSGSRAREVHAGVWNNVGAEHFAKGRPREALQAFERAVALNPGDARTHGNLGAAWLRLGNQDAAERNLREALRLEPLNVTARSNLGALLLARGDLGGAERELRAALRISPGDTEATYNMACVAAKRGDRDAALRWLERLRAQGYRQPEAIRADSDLAPLRGDPRFERLLARMGRSSG